MDTTQSTNLLEFAEGSFKEEVHIDLEGKQTKTLNCSLCDFTNHNVGGMKRHILGSHKPKEKNEKMRRKPRLITLNMSNMSIKN